MQNTNWNPKSWRDKIALQQPIYEDLNALEAIEKKT